MKQLVSNVVNVVQVIALELKLTSTLWSGVLGGRENLSSLEFGRQKRLNFETENIEKTHGQVFAF